MTRGPDQQRLLTYVTPGDDVDLRTAEDQWRKAAGILDQMGKQLRLKATAIRESSDIEFSGQTAATAATAFEGTAATMDTKSKDMHDGSVAFGRASTALHNAQTISGHLEKRALGAFPKDPGIPPGSSQPEDVKAQSDYDTAVGNYWTSYHEHERTARQAISALEESHTEQALVFQRIHGEVPPPEPPGPGGGGTLPTHTPASTTHTPTSHLTNHDHVHDTTTDDTHPDPPDVDEHNDPTDDNNDDNTDNNNTNDPGIPQGPTHPTTPGTGGTLPGGSIPGGGVGGGVGAAGGVGVVGGGALGGMAAAGLGVNGGLNGMLPGGAGVRGGLSASGVRGIGATSRTGVGSVLGRSTSGAGRLGAGGMAGRNGGRGSGRGGSRSGTGSRGRAGARGAGAGAGGRNGKDKKRQGEERDLFDDGADWIDDEDAAPGLLD